jgi:hypothetical protein
MFSLSDLDHPEKSSKSKTSSLKIQIFEKGKWGWGLTCNYTLIVGLTFNYMFKK